MTTASLPIERLAQYRLEERLGAGAMGTVYAAFDEEEKHRVALKVVHPHLLDRKGFLRRFEREAELGERVDHPNVVRTLDADFQVVGGAPWHFLVMEYVEGQTLRALLDEYGHVPEALVREVGRQIANGLAAIHDAGIVHRDVKPENVLITTDRRVRIMDLGVAKPHDSDLSITQDGQFAGSLLYAAPEQLRARDVGPAADLYALGMVLYELATGSHAVQHEDRPPSVGDLLGATPRPPSEVLPELTPLFDEVTLELLAADPASRVGSATELAAILAEGEDGAWWTEREAKLRHGASAIPRVPVQRETKLYGREEHLTRLKHAWAEARQLRGNTVLLEGEAGIGKSRVIGEFLQGLGERSTQVLYGSYSPTGGIGGITDAILGRFGRGDLESKLRPHLTMTPTLVPAFAALLKHEPKPEEAPSLPGESLQAVLVHLMRALAGEEPLIWVIEDLHFADAASLGLVLSLARAVEGHPILLLLTTRPGLEAEDLASLGRLENLERATLSRLGAREVFKLLQDAFQSECLAKKLGGKIALKSDGVPFFVFELIRRLEERGLIAQLPDGNWVESEVIDDIEIPSTVRDLIQARLRGLSDEERAILDVGAVLGFEFDPDLVALVLERPRIAVLQGVASVERRSGVLRAVGHSVSFDHHQIQEVLYEDLMPALREAYHGRVAEVMEVRAGDDVERLAEVAPSLAVTLCRHNLLGGREQLALRQFESALAHREFGHWDPDLAWLARRLLEVPGLTDSERRVTLLLSAESLLERLGWRSAQAAVLEEAWQLVESGASPASKGAVLARLAHLEGTVGRFEAAEQHLEELLALAEAKCSREDELMAEHGLAKLGILRGQYEVALLHAERALDLARQSDAATQVGWCCGVAGTALSNMARAEEARVHHDRQLEIARELGSRRMEASAMGNLGMTLHVQGRLAESVTRSEQAVQLAREIGTRDYEVSITLNLAASLFALGRAEDAHARGLDALHLAREIGNPVYEIGALKSLGQHLTYRGKYAEAREHLNRALGLAQGLGHRPLEAGVLDDLGSLARNQGDPAAAIEFARRSLTCMRGSASPRAITFCHGNLGCSLWAAGRYAQAQQHLVRAHASSRDSGDAMGEAVWLVNLGGVFLELGEMAQAREAVVASLRLARAVGARRPEACALLNLGAITDEEGDARESQACLEESVRVASDIDHQQYRVYGLLGLADLHRREGNDSVARTHLIEAVTLSTDEGFEREHARALIGLAQLPGGDAEDARRTLVERTASNEDIGDFHAMWSITHEHSYLCTAKRLLDYRVEHAPEEYRESMLENVRLYREIESAWKALHAE